MTHTRLPPLDVHFVRSCFPTFAEPVAAKTAFFENAGGSYVTGAVLDRLMHFYRVNKVQPYGYSELQCAAGEQMDAGRHAIAELLGVDQQTITLGPSTTQNINTLAMACASMVCQASEVIVTEQDHEANIGAWQRLCQRQNATLKIWPVDPQTGELDMATFENMLCPSTKLVCITHSSNIVGSINPVEQVIALCRQNDTRVIVDGVSYAPHQWPDLAALAPDAYVFSTYKTYATHLGVMYTTAQFNQQIDPQCHIFNKQVPYKRLDGAGPDHAAIAALAGLRDYFSASYDHHFSNNKSPLHQKAQQLSTIMHSHENSLCEQLLDGIAHLPLRIIGKPQMNHREANVSITSSQYSSAALSRTLAEQHIATGYGHFYAPRLLQKVGIVDPEDGVLRISFAHYNNQKDVDRIIDVLRSLH